MASLKGVVSTSLTLIVSSVLLTACGKQGATTPPPQGGLPEVGVFTVTPRAVTLSTELPGRTAPYQIAEIRPQVSGIIQKRLFVEGTEVKAGSLLYQIDPALYQASFNSAKAALAKAEANLVTVRLRAVRYKELVAINAISKQENDDAQAALRQGEADVASAKAAMEAARINLAYTALSSPITGRIGKSDVTPGALVTANQPTVLTTVQQLDPIYVDVTQTANEWLRLKRDFDSGRLHHAGKDQVEVELFLPDGSHYAEKGLLKFSGVSVDQSTGSFLVRAEFKNPKTGLLPGMYVRARIVEGTNEQAIIVPQQGITRNPLGAAVALVVAEDGTVSQRIVKTERALGNEWLISEGLQAGDKIIVEGLQRIRFIPGAPPPKVKAVEKERQAALPDSVLSASSPANTAIPSASAAVTNATQSASSTAAKTN